MILNKYFSIRYDNLSIVCKKMCIFLKVHSDICKSEMTCLYLFILSKEKNAKQRKIKQILQDPDNCI